MSAEPASQMKEPPVSTATFVAVQPSMPARVWAWLTDQGAVVGILLLLVLAWELATWWLAVPVYILPSPSVILAKIGTDWALLASNGWASLQEILLGFGLAVVVGIPLAVAIVYSRIFERVAFPLMVSLQTIPKVALAPILVMWFGYGLLPKVLVAFLISFFPIVMNTVIGMRSVEREMIYLAQSMGAGHLQTFMKIRLPKALPNIFGGFKVGMGLAVIGAIVGEFIAAEEGLGYLMLVAQVRLDSPLLFACVVILSILGVVLFNVLVGLERLLIPWHRQITEHVE
jgi:NitT/TauT family transport system permease protein